MSVNRVYLWQKAPSIRLLLSLIAGILLQWYIKFSIAHILLSAVVCFFFVVGYSILPVQKKFQLKVFNGVALVLLIIFAGAAITWSKNIQHKKNWFGHILTNEPVLITLKEPLVVKPNSYKAEADVTLVYKNDSLIPTKGKIILYFKKDSTTSSLGYGSQIIISKQLQEIKNSGNPGGFNYKQYSLFQGITHQVYLTEKDFTILDTTQKNFFQEFIFHSRTKIVSILKKFIKGSKEQGLAEALLIGYKDDLDKKLVESYTNTGVIHVIAISGLHLGLIYWLLLQLTKPLKRKKLNWFRVIIIIASLWLFSFLAGAQPSVVRSAIMFSFIAFAEVLMRKTSIFNTLALSAFLLLCINPFWLWDVGFQLSYSAVLSIIIFFRPIYNWVYLPNKIIDFFWKLMAVSIAAQILTAPISLYHFHQFPFLFLFTNIVAVPLSSLILIGEILLCIISFIEPVAKILGAALEWMIYFMNSYIERFNAVSFAVWDGIHISVLQTIFLYAAITGTGFWLLEKKKKGLIFSASFLLAFIVFRSVDFIKANNQKKLIVYNVPKHQAIDFVDGRKYNFIGDAELKANDFLRNFHIQPSRVVHRIKPVENLPGTKALGFYDKSILIIDNTVQIDTTAERKKVDVIILSKNPKLYINQLVKAFEIQQLVIDASVPAWKAKLWKRDCQSLKISCYDVTENGAFVMNL